MMYKHHFNLSAPNASLLILNLTQNYEGDYHLSLNIEFHNRRGFFINEERTVHVTVDGECLNIVHHMMTCLTPLSSQIYFALSSVPVSTPVIDKNPHYAVVEDKANVTWTCSVERGTRLVYKWLRDNVALGPSDRYHFSQDNATLFISPVRKEDKGSYRCEASNAISQAQHSKAVELNVYCE